MEASSRQRDISVKAGLWILFRVYLNHPAHFSAIFGGNPGGVDAERLDIVGLNLGSKTWRAIVSQRNVVHHELGLILGAARVKYSVPFIEPTGLRIDQFLQRAARNRA